MATESAGILLYRGGDAGPQVLLAHPGGPFWAKKDRGAWSIPKGELAEGEDPQRCALRELAEELGPAAPVPALDELISLGSVRQKRGKIVHAWALEGKFDPAELHSNSFELEWPRRSGEKRKFPEIDRAEWFDPPIARQKIIAAQAALLDRLLEYLAGRSS